VTPKPLALLTYHISLTAQGVPLRCPTCKADDMWSPESRPDSTEIDYYLCLGCQQYRVDEAVVMGRIVADPKVDSLLVTFGDLLEDILYEQHHWAAAAGLFDEAADIEEWLGWAGAVQ
jgi:hypothetical protein